MLAALLIVFAASAGSVAHADFYGGSYGGSYGGGYYGGGYGGSGGSDGAIISMDLDPHAQLNTSFRIAAREDRENLLDDLIKQGADLNGQSDQGITALMYAARNCSEKTVTHLLSIKANADLQDNRGRSALTYAVREGCTNVVKRLLDKTSAELIVRQDKDKMNAFDYAGSSPDLVAMLAQKRRSAASKKTASHAKSKTILARSHKLSAKLVNAFYGSLLASFPKED